MYGVIKRTDDKYGVRRDEHRDLWESWDRDQCTQVGVINPGEVFQLIEIKDCENGYICLRIQSGMKLGWMDFHAKGFFETVASEIFEEIVAPISKRK